MDVRLALRVGPGESGVAETHTWLLKEAKTVNQVLEFVRAKVHPFLGSQAELSIEATPEPKPEPKKATSAPKPKKKQAKKKKEIEPDDSEEWKEGEDDDEEPITPDEIEKINTGAKEL
jgi:hypothetical protein